MIDSSWAGWGWDAAGPPPPAEQATAGRAAAGSAWAGCYELMLPKQAAGGVMRAKPDSWEALSW
jgi:hypothetical protein